MPWRCDCGSSNTLVCYVCDCGYEWSTTEPPLDPDGRPGAMPCPDSLLDDDGTPLTGCGCGEVLPRRARCANCKTDTYLS